MTENGLLTLKEMRDKRMEVIKYFDKNYRDIYDKIYDYAMTCPLGYKRKTNVLIPICYDLTLVITRVT